MIALNTGEILCDYALPVLYIGEASTIFLNIRQLYVQVILCCTRQLYVQVILC